jgi:16S rRNA G966 N2-methylase RsmD
MRMQLNAAGQKKLRELLETKIHNMETAETLINFLTSSKRYLNKRSIDRIANLHKMTEADAFAKLILIQSGVHEKDARFPLIEKKYLQGQVHHIDAAVYEQNPYFKTIHCQDTKLGRWTLRYDKYLPYQAFAYQDLKVNPTEHYLEVTPLGYLHQSLAYLAVAENDVTWMSVTPFEIETMQPLIDQVKGHVLMLGLGLGYFAFMATLKTNVHHVTIIEKNQNIIKLFKEHILPQFPHQDKITVIQADALTYAETYLKDQKFGSVFVDLYHDAKDGLAVYLKMKKMEMLQPTLPVYYWLEKSILALLRRYVLILIEEQQRGLTEKDYQANRSFDDRVVNALYQATKTTTLKHEADLTNMLSDQSLAYLAKKLVVSV